MKDARFGFISEELYEAILAFRDKRERYVRPKVWSKDDEFLHRDSIFSIYDIPLGRGDIWTQKSFKSYLI